MPITKPVLTLYGGALLACLIMLGVMVSGSGGFLPAPHGLPGYLLRGKTFEPAWRCPLLILRAFRHSS